MPSSRPTKGKVIVFGILFWYPLAGVTFQFLHYLIALRRLGYDPYYIEDSARWVYDPLINNVVPDAATNVAAIAPILEAYGFGGRWGFRQANSTCFGLTESAILALYRDADAFLNVTGAQELRDEHLKCPLRIYVETDPVASQIKVAAGDAKSIQALSQHHVHFSFGENFGAPDCGVPLVRFDWKPTRQPVALDLWAPAAPRADTAYTTVATWENRGQDITYRGEVYRWSKHHEFLKIIDLPRRSPARFEIAIHGVGDDEARLINNGWRLVDSLAISADLSRYQAFIRSSRGEFTVAKDQNIRLRSGWFSDRSACYLAAARPVITQDTGFGAALPTGRGLFPFQTIEDILAAVDCIEQNYTMHSRAARDIAEEYFSAEKVVGSLMTRAGIA